MRWALWTSLAGVILTGASRAGAVCTITGDYTIECDGTVYRAVDDECVYFVDLAAHNAAHPDTPLPDLKKTIADNYDADAVPQPVVVALTDYVDCTQTDHNFSDANIIPSVDVPLPGNPFNTNPHPNQPSRLMTIGGKTFRVTAAPDDGFATYYFTYDVSTGGTAGVPHLLIAESINDQERYTSLAIHHGDQMYEDPQLETQRPFPTYDWAPPYTGEGTTDPWGDGQVFERTQNGKVFGPDVGLATYTGREIPIDDQPFNITMLFYPKQTTVRVVVSTSGANEVRTGDDGGAVSQLWIFALADPMAYGFPAHTPPDDPAEERRIGIYMTHPWYFYEHYAAPPTSLAFRQQSLERLVEHMKFCGMNYIVFNAINGSDRSERRWYENGQYFSWNSAGDLLVELPPVAQAEGIQLVPLITSLQRTSTNGLSITSQAYQVGADGDYTRAFGEPTLDPLHPATQSIMFDLLEEIAAITASSPAVRGIGIRVNGKIGTCYTADQDGLDGAMKSGYSEWDLQQFKNDTGSGVPTSPPSSAYNWLVTRPNDWESWIDWRCQKTREFWLACRDLIKTWRSDLVFYVQCDLPSEVPGTNIDWPAETPYNLLRHHGYDPDMFESDTGIVISRGMMVAADRYFVGSRWAHPFGTNHQDYRLFHFAPDLAELYRTAEGRACEMYQNYWEEARHPYFEFGDPLNPLGYFRTTTPAAPGRAFFEGPIMSVRRQDPDTITWLGWNRPTLGHENDLRKFAQAFRALPVVDSIPFDGTVEPAIEQIVARWYRDRLAVINDTNTACTITLHFAEPVPSGAELTDVVTGRRLVSAHQTERQHLSFEADAYSLNIFLYTEPAGPVAVNIESVATVADHGPAGEIGLAINLAASSLPDDSQIITTESREEGITRLLIDCDDNVILPSPPESLVESIIGINNGDVATSVVSVTAVGDIITISLSALPDQDTYTVTLAGSVIAGDNDFLIRALQGEVDNGGNSSQVVNALDLSELRINFSADVTAGDNAKYDIVSDGAINALDLSQCRIMFTHTAP